MPQIRLASVGKDFPQEHERQVVHAVRSVDLPIERGEFVFVTGSSGAGKSTLLDLIACQIQPTTGNVFLNDINVTRMARRQWVRRRLCFGYVPQFPSLARKRTIEENLTLAALLGQKRTPQPPADRVRKSLSMVGLGDVAGRYPVELSTGECRRVELARAIISNPEILVLDELTANLDDDTVWDMFLFLSELNRHGITIIMASHAKKFVNLMRRRVITLVDGTIRGDVQKGRYGDVGPALAPDPNRFI